MASPLAGNPASYPAEITIPDDGDPRSVSSVNVGLEALADRTANLDARTARVGDLAIMLAAAGRPNGSLFYAIGYGLYIRITAGGYTPVGTYVLDAADGGQWVHESLLRLNVNGGLAAIGVAGAAANRVPASVVPNRIVGTYFMHSLPSVTNVVSTSVVNVVGYALEIQDCEPGDRLVISGAAEWSTSAATAGEVGTLYLYTADGAYQPELLSQRLTLPAAGVAFRGCAAFSGGFIVVNGGDVLVLCRAKSSNSGHSLTFGDSYGQASMSVLHIRP
jgi:hypothetical protein